MKIVIAIVIVAAIAIFVGYRYGGVKSFDPTEQGKQAKAAITTGMAWNKVIDAAGAPHKYHVIQKTKKTVAGTEIETVAPGPALNFTTDTLKASLAANAMPEGFVFDYNFSAQVSFCVWFDNAGLVTSVDDMRTVADLLDTRKD